MNGFYRKGGTSTLWRGLGFDSDGSTPSDAVSPSPAPAGQARGRRIAGMTFYGVELELGDAVADGAEVGGGLGGGGGGVTT